MTNYTKTTDFAVKDTLLTGNPNKLVKGSEVDVEFNNLALADLTNIKKTGSAGSAIFPSGTTAQRDAVPAIGYARANTTTGLLEWWNGTEWTSPNGANSVSYNPAGTGAVATTVQGKLRESVSVKDFGADPTGVADSTAAIIAANLAAAGKTVLFPAGTYKFTGDLTPGNATSGSKTIWKGEGWQTKLQAADSTSRILVTNSCSLKDFWLIGSNSSAGAYVGTGIQIGNTDFVGQVELENVRVRYFAKGTRFAAALWTTLTKCLVDYCQYGYDFNAGSALLYSTTVSFYDCVASNCDRNGVAGTYVPINNTNISFYGGNVENCSLSAPATYPMFSLGGNGQPGGARPFVVDGMYLEYSVVGTKPTFINTNLMSQGRISNNYFNSPTYGIYDGSAGTTDVTIFGNLFTGTVTADISLVSCTRINAWGNTLVQAAACVITGTGSRLNKTGAIANLDTEGGTFTPTLTGSGGTSANTYVWQSGFYTKIGNLIHFHGVVRVSAVDAGMTGTARVNLVGMPTSWNTTNNNAIIQVMLQSVTLSASRNHAVGRLDTNTAIVDIYEEGSNVSASLMPVGNITASAIIWFSGHYMVAPGA